MLERIGTAAFQRTLSGAMRKNQGNLSDTQMKLATGKRAMIYRDLGTGAMASISARSMLTREENYSTTITGVRQTLNRYDAALGHLSGAATNLYEAVGKVISLGEARGFATELESAFSALKQTMNTNQAGDFIFAGGRTDTPPLAVSTLDELSVLPAVTDAFVDEDLEAQARVGDATDMIYGLKASDVGTEFAGILRQLKDLGPIDGKMSAAQLDTLNGIFGNLKSANGRLADIQASNGERMQQTDVYADRAESRQIQLKTYIGEQEDVDMAEITTQMVNDQLALQASYQAFSQIKDLSLISFLR